MTLNSLSVAIIAFLMFEENAFRVRGGALAGFSHLSTNEVLVHRSLSLDI